MNNPLKYPNMMIEMAMYLYMDINTKFVIDSLQDSDTNNAQLK